MDAFKKDFKYYKQKKPPPDLSQVIDFETLEKWEEMVIPVTLTSRNDDKTLRSLGIKECSEWEVFSVKDSPGFLFIRNPFVQGAQWDLVVKCLKVYSCKPNLSNLDAHMDVKNSIWDISLERSFDKKSPLYKLRWVTLGYHYNWDNKTYSQDVRSEFPSDLSKLFITLANSLGFQNFTPEAGIINYYHLDSTLAGHTDHSEHDLDAPLFSLSLGQSAIFLLGGESRNHAPIPMYMRSGDIMVMAGKSRLAYHAVPRILTPSSEHQSAIPSCLAASCSDTSGNELLSCQSKEKDCISTKEETEFDTQRSNTNEVASKRQRVDNSELPDVSSEFLPGERASGKMMSIEKAETDLILQYLSCSRINVNIRQVLKPGQSFPRNHDEIAGDLLK